MNSTVVVVGGGYGGATVAKALDDVAEVILVEKRDAFVHNVASLRAVGDPAWADRMFLPYEGLLARGRVVRGHAELVEPGVVTLASGERVEADFVVLATGSDYPFPAKVGDLDTAGAKARLTETRAALDAADSVLLLGAGPVGLEFAGEIRAAWPDKKITIVDPFEEILSTMPAEMGAEAKRQLAELGVELLLGTSLLEPPVSEAGQVKPFTVALTSGAEVSADIWFRCYGAAPVTDYLAGGSLAGNRLPSGLVDVGDTLQLVGQERVFALGDITGIDEPKKAKAAEDHAQLIAANIRTLIEGGTELATYQVGGPMMALSIGPTGGVGYTPAHGLLGAEMTARAKSADLRTTFYEELFGVTHLD
ncbi:FAD-dependent oxidoreductase [Streptacidiphilus sp. N1-12]|uniref:FAD-dependent oxidoreductase n=2 Tax=Streptacidiphilus alkalitolerans TaxID=3342712 RepID=A0ABV6VBT9_9ACTN